MRTDTHEKVLEKLATGDKAIVVIERQTGAKCARRWDPPIERYDPYGPGPGVSAYAGDEAIDD